MMGFVKDLLKAAGPKGPAFQPPAIPAQLPKIAAPTAAEIAKSSAPKPEAMEVLKANPQQTPSQFLGALQEKQMGDEMVKTLAHGLPDREGVAWAAQSAQTVADKLPPADVQALQAAQAWTKTPTAATQAAAATAAEKAGMTGPGGMAAQAAAWAKPAIPPAAPAAGVTLPRLAPFAVAGAVQLAAAIKANPSAAAPKPVAQVVTAAAKEVPLPATVPAAAPAGPPPTIPPDVQSQTFQAQHPYIASGIDFATGKTPV
jgi:hypothetical protein